MTKEWKNMTFKERQIARFDRWRNPGGGTFASESIQADYISRVNRVIDAVTLEKTPDRVPVLSPASFLPCTIYGVPFKDAMYDMEKAVDLWLRFLKEFPTDLAKGPAYCGTGKAFELLDYKLYKWPGFNLPDNVGFQAVEQEWMKKDEYPMLIDDMTDFWLRRYMPRIFGVCEPLSALAPLNRIIEIPNVGQLANFGLPGVREAFNKLADAGEMLLKVRQDYGRFRQVSVFEMGFPSHVGGAAKAPYDVLADTLRASRGMVMDMFRNTDAILKAIERITPWQIKGAVGDADASGNPFIFIPLHKGADGWMSDEQFKTLYWPSLKTVILGLVEQGCVPLLFAEGGYSTRLSYLNELPKGTTMWMFDRTDMAEVKKVAGDNVCIAGNVPTGLMITGSAEQVDDYCHKLIDDCAPGGGFILTTGAALDEGKADTTHALVTAADKYGWY